ncbi:MAG: AAA family ATPase, partial [Minisyncoccia bacterium]
KDFNWDSNIPDFKRYNAFYGWNGSGKTTITRLLSAFEKVELGRLELEDDSTFVIETNSDTLKLSKNEPISDSLKNRIRVFNEDFVNENLDWEKGKASKILVVGKEQIKRKEELKSIINELGDKDRDLVKKKKEKEGKDKEKIKILEKARDEIKNSLREVNDVSPKSGRATDYINYTVTDVEKILKGEEFLFLEEDEFLKLKNSLKENEPKEIINEIVIDLGWIKNIIEKSQEIFKIIIPEEGIRLLRDSEKIDEKLKDWLRVGYEIHKDRQHPIKCEFCKNEISEKRMKELGEYFSGVLINLIKEIEQVIENISFDKLPKWSLQKEQFYSQFQSSYLELNNEFNQRENLIREELDKIKKALTEKKNNPSQTITFDFDILNRAIKDLKNIVERINSLIKKNNEKTNSFKEKRIESAHKLELAIISRYKSNYDEKIEDLKLVQKEIDSLSKEKTELENQKKELEQKLKEHHFAAEEFNKLLKSFMGRSEIVLETVDEGYMIRRNGRTANNLSEGERGAIALIYFLIKLKEENFDAKNGIIIIDDPVSSFDSQYLYGAFGFIKEKIKELNPRQVFIFTHHFPFFRLVRDWMKHEGRDNFSFYIIKSRINNEGRYSVIEKIDQLLEKHNSEYTYLFKLIYQRAQEQDSSLEKDYIFPNAIRKFLENYMSFKIPRGGVSIHEKFQMLCKDYPEIDLETKTRIESYCQDQSHPLYQDSPIDFDERLLGEVQLVCSAIVKLIEKTDTKHYQHLLKECGINHV